MVGVLITLLFCVGALGVGRFVVGRLTGDLDPAARLGLNGMVGLGTLGLLTLPIGLLPEGLHWGIWVMGLLALAGLALVAAKKRPKLKLPSAGWLLAPLMIGVAALFALIGVLAPSDTLDWDSLAYHLAVPKIWLHDGRISYISYIHHSNFPLSVDGLFIWGLSWGGQHGAKAFSWVYFLLGILALFGLARSRYGEKAAWWSALAFATIPVVAWEAGTAYIDVANGLFAGLGLYFAAQLVAAPSKRDAWLAAVFLGFAAGSKYTGLQTIGVAAAVVLVGLFLERKREIAVKPISATVLLVAVSVLISAPWYAKNVANTGNPVYPFFYGVFGGKNWSDYNAMIYTREQQTFGAGRAMATPQQPDYTKNPLDPLRLGHSVLGLTYQPGRYINPAPTQGGGLPMGALGVTALAAWLLWMLSGRMGRFEASVAAEVGVSFLMWFVLTQQARYVVALAAPLSVMFGGGVVQLRMGKGLAALGVLQTVVGLAVLYQFLVTAQLQVVTGKVGADEYQAERIEFYEPAQFINKNVVDGRVALYDEVFGYLLDVPYFWANPGHTTELGYDRMKTADDLVASLKAHGITYVYFNLAPTRQGDRAFSDQWLAASGLQGPPVPFPPEVRQGRMADIGSRYLILVAEAAGSGKLTLVQPFKRSFLFQVR